MKKIFVVFSVLGLLAAVSGVFAGESGEKLSREQLLQDARQLLAILEEVHPDPYLAGGGKIAFHKRFQQLLMAIPKEGMTAEAFCSLLAPFVASVGDGHTWVYCHSSSAAQTTVPLRFWVVGQELVLMGVFHPEHKPLLGARLLAVQGVPLATLLERAGQRRGWANPYEPIRNLQLMMTLFEPELRALLPEWSGDAPLKFLLQLPSGETKEVSVALENRQKLGEPLCAASKLQLPKLGKGTFDWAFLDPAGKVAYLRISQMVGFREGFEDMFARGDTNADDWARNTYFAIHGKQAPADRQQLLAGIPSATERFRELVVAMKAKKSDTLIVDVQENSGGDSLMVEILAYFLYSHQELAKASGISAVTKLSEQLFKQYTNVKLEDFSDRVPFPLKKNDYVFDDEFYSSAQSKGEEDDDCFEDSPTFCREWKSGSFRAHYRPANVMVLTSAGTYSSAAALAIVFFKLGATLVGVPSSQPPNSYGNVLFFELGNSKLRGQVSNKRFEFFPDDPEKGRVLRPQVELTYEKLASLAFDPNATLILALEAAGHKELLGKPLATQAGN